VWRNPEHIDVGFEQRVEHRNSGFIFKMSNVGVRDRHTRWGSGGRDIYQRRDGTAYAWWKDDACHCRLHLLGQVKP